MSSTGTNQMVEKALQTASWWPVFPCRPRDEPQEEFWQRRARMNEADRAKAEPFKAKSPLTWSGHKDATKSEAQIRSWWAAWPDAMIGVPTGDVVGYFVLDVDRPDGPASLAELEALHGPLPETVTQKTGSGGEQRFFLMPTDGREVRNTTSKIGKNLDIRGTGGYVIVAPSIHPTGSPYQWLKTPRTTGTQFAEAPAWLLDMVAKEKVVKTAPSDLELDQDNFVLIATRYLVKSAPVAIEGQGGDAATLQVAMEIRDIGVSEALCLELMLEWWNDRCQPPWGAEELAQKVANAYKYAQNKGIGAKAADLVPIETAFLDAWIPELPAELDDLQIPQVASEGEKTPAPIRLVAGALTPSVVLAERALMHSSVPYHDTMYQRGGQLVRVCRLPEGGTERGVSRPAGVVVILRVTADFLLQALSQHVRFQKIDGRTKDKKWVPADPPKQLADLILARSGKWPFPALRGVLACPTVRPDGSLLLNPGYDLPSGYFMAHKLRVGVNDAPSREDAVAALGKLKALLEGFAFVEEVDQSVAISLILTAVIRAALDTAPLITTTATTRGSGKTTLGDTASVLATGRCCPAVAATMDRMELEKRLVASLLSGDAIVNLDNINGELGSDLLCQATTGPSLKIRPLGSSSPVEIPNTALWIANGNNMTVTGDLARRTLKCRLDPGVERPELRRFAFNPIQEAARRREEILGDVLTLVRAYVAAGKPPIGKPPMGSFEAWSELVRAPIVWAGGADPCDSYEMVVDEDPEAENLRALLEAWHDCFGDERKTVKEATELGKEGFAPEGLEDALGRLKGVAEVIAGGSRDEAKALGRFISRSAGRIMGGKKFAKCPPVKGVTSWRVVGVGQC